MKKKYKIAVLVDLLVPGGVQKTAIQEVANLRKMGFDALLLVLMRHGFSQKNSYLVKDIPHEFLSDRYPKFLQNSHRIPPFKFLSTLHLLSPLIAPFKVKKGEFGAILSHGTTTSFTSLSLFYFKKIPYITMIHDPMAYIFDKVYSKTLLKQLTPLFRFITPYLERKIVKNAYFCFVASTVHAKFLKSNYKIDPQILYLGVKASKDLPKKHGVKVLSFGRWEKEKNIAKILELAESLPNNKFTVAGTWTDKRDLAWFKKEISARKLQNRVELIVNYTEEQLTKLCRQSRFWVHPNFEAFSLSALEAASHGLPIIIPKGSGVTELFTEGKHGFFPNVNDKKTYIKTMRFLLNNPQQSNKMGLNAAKIAKAYTWAKHSQIIANKIRKILS